MNTIGAPMTELGTLYREVANGEFQSRSTEVGPLEVHPDYLLFIGRREFLNSNRSSNVGNVGVYAAMREIEPVLEVFADNDDRPIPLEELLPPTPTNTRRRSSIERHNVDTTRSIASLNILIEARLLGTEKLGDTTHVYVHDDTRDLNHHQPFYTSNSELTPVVGLMAGAIAGAAIIGNPVIDSFAEEAITMHAYGTFISAGLFASYGANGLLSAIRARRYYKQHGF